MHIDKHRRALRAAVDSIADRMKAAAEAEA